MESVVPLYEKRKEMRITYVISTLRRGGAERMLVNLINALPTNIHVDIVVLKSDISMAEHLVHPNAKLHVLNMRSHWDFLGWLRFLKLVRRLHPDVVHSHMLLANLSTRLAKVLCGFKVLINHEHGLGVWKGRPLCFIDRITQFLANKVITVSVASREIRLKRERIDSDRVIVMHNAINWEEWNSVPPAPNGNCASWGIAATLKAVKRIHIGLELLAEVRKNGSKARLLIAGDGPQQKMLEAKCNKLGLNRFVKFLGYIQDMRQFYANVDVVLLTSLREDFPMTLLEGLAAGKFVVASSVGGVPEILESAPDAVIIDDVSDLSSVVRRLANVDAGFNSKANRNYAKQFSICNYVDRITELYTNLLQK
ncbi:D-inositol-3-phosphate glycosyltransferase [subsurface metagenome]